MYFVSPVSAQMTRRPLPSVDQGRVGDFTRSGGGCVLLYSDASNVYFDIMLINVLNNEHSDWIYRLEKDARKGRKRTVGRKKRATRTKIECKYIYIGMDIGSVLKWLVDIHGVFIIFTSIDTSYFFFFVPYFFFLEKLVTR